MAFQNFELMRVSYRPNSVKSCTDWFQKLTETTVWSACVDALEITEISMSQCNVYIDANRGRNLRQGFLVMHQPAVERDFVAVFRGLRGYFFHFKGHQTPMWVIVALCVLVDVKKFTWLILEVKSLRGLAALIRSKLYYTPNDLECFF